MGEKKRKADFKAKIGLPEGFNPSKDMRFISDEMNGPVALSYLIYAHNQGVTLRDLAAALLQFVEHTMKEWIADDECTEGRAEYAAIQAKAIAAKAEIDGGLSLDEKYVGFIEFLEEWGDTEVILDNHLTIATALVTYHRAGQSILNVIEQICSSDEKPNDPAVLHEAARWEKRPGGKMDALIHFDDEDADDEDDEDY